MAETTAPEEALADLHFQLASVDRNRILSELQRNELHVNEAAKRLSMTATETLRQFQRLAEGGLIEKRPDGKYLLSNYGKLVLDSASPLDFISRYRGFFRNHDAFLLPKEYRARLVELSGAKLVPDTIESMNVVAEMLRGARERIGATIEIGGQLHLEIMEQRVTDGLKVRWLMQESFLPKAKDLLRSAKKFPEMRHIPRLRVHVYQTEKEAAVALRLNSGQFDYAIFHGGDSQFLKYANELFAHEWESGKPWYP